MADEHTELIADLSCNLAKHRKSDTVDRKDIQLAYGEAIRPLPSPIACR